MARIATLQSLTTAATNRSTLAGGPDEGPHDAALTCRRLRRALEGPSLTSCVWVLAPVTQRVLPGFTVGIVWKARCAKVRIDANLSSPRYVLAPRGRAFATGRFTLGSEQTDRCSPSTSRASSPHVRSHLNPQPSLSTYAYRFKDDARVTGPVKDTTPEHAGQPQRKGADAGIALSKTPPPRPGRACSDLLHVNSDTGKLRTVSDGVKARS